MMNQQQRGILGRSNVGAELIRLAHGLASGSSLNLQTRVRISLYLAARDLCVYPLAELQESGRKAGLHSAEMAGNMTGISHDKQGSACLDFVAAVIDGKPVLDTAQYRNMMLAGFRQEQVLEVITQATIHLLLVRLCAAITTHAETVNFLPLACSSTALESQS
ncbi:hypothetical protein [Rugamonas sp.]|uniref:hypothetical protein n=1 Tax=Rugamonas sp. TaxID=1926287 RepID=UPI0025EDBF38|nr:hypothetical protein [Rugamonas sp.]